MRHVTGLLAEMFHWQCFNHYWIREQEEGIAIPLNPYMVDAVMGGEEIRDLHPWGGIRLLLAQPPDMVTAPQSLFFSRPGRLYWRKLGEDKVQEVDQSRQGDSGQKLPEQGKQCFRFVLQVPHTYQVRLIEIVSHQCVGRCTHFQLGFHSFLLSKDAAWLSK